jgi:hypothetical protein
MGDEINNGDVYVSDSGDTWAFDGYFRSIWAIHHRAALLHAKPERLNAPVYEQIESEMVGWESERSLEKHIAELRKIAAKAPKGRKVVIEFDRESDYEGGYDTYRRIGFYRPPTDEEVEERRARNAEIREVQAEAKLAADEKERQEFERLKAKYATNA